MGAVLSPMRRAASPAIGLHKKDGDCIRCFVYIDHRSKGSRLLTILSRGAEALKCLRWISIIEHHQIPGLPA